MTNIPKRVGVINCQYYRPPAVLRQVGVPPTD